MIPGAFDYHRPKNLNEAIGLLNDLGEDARAIAGGHSLIPMMKMRLASPSHLIDLRGLRDLNFIRVEGAEMVIGAMTTQHEVIGSAELAAKVPLLREAALQIADPQIRYVGTIGGNVANGDPGNDMPAVMMCLNASYDIAGKGGTRRVAAREFYQGAYFTALEPGELVTAIRIPMPTAGHKAAYEKLKRKIGDYAIAAAAVLLSVSGGKVTGASIALTNVGETPLLAADAAALLVGQTPDKMLCRKAGQAAAAISDPASDARGPVVYRRQMAGIMTERALIRALGLSA
ncbi:xanthine dehydrogenase family protein subunit M [Dongia sp.]|uniref:FAD binding domain-containing protein n=1 Tax=Dongia sp. TaxID=1977262 RepID=UPI0035AF3E97